jgi:hypothetical protein
MGWNLTSFIAVGKHHVKVGTARIVPLYFGNDTLKIELQRGNSETILRHLKFSRVADRESGKRTKESSQ